MGSLLAEKNHTEFEAFKTRTQSRALELALGMTHNRDDAEDLTQEAYIAAYKGFDGYNRSLSFESWFFHILKRKSIDVWRRHKGRPKPSSLNDLQDYLGDGNGFEWEVVDRRDGPEALVCAQYLDDEDLEKAIRQLPIEVRRATVLYYIKQMSYQEISVRMRCSYGTTRSRLHLARRLLRKHF